MFKILLFVSVFIASCTGIFAQVGFGEGKSEIPDPKPKSKLGLPVLKSRLIKVLAENKSNEFDIISVIRANGVDFMLDPETKNELEQAGASGEIMAAVRQNYRLPIGVANGKATNLVVPKYPEAAETARASGSVNVLVLIDENGNVIDAKAISGHALLAQAAVEAALASKFTPIKISGQKVKATGIVIYNFSK